MTSKNVVIRAATREDMNDLLNLIRKTLKYDQRFARRYYERFFDDEDEMTEGDAVYVACLGGATVGVIGYARDYLSTDFAYWLGWFAVHQGYQGQKIGTKLLRRVEKDLRKKGKKKLFVSTEDSNAAAKNFYIRRGFRTEGVVRDYYSKGEDELIMSKDL